MPELKIKIGGDSTEFAAVAAGAIKTAQTSAKQLAKTQIQAASLLATLQSREGKRLADIDAASRSIRARELRRERAQARAESFARASLDKRNAEIEQAARSNRARALRRERAEARAAILLRAAEEKKAADIEQASRNIRARALRRERAEARAIKPPPIIAPPVIQQKQSAFGGMFAGLRGFLPAVGGGVVLGFISRMVRSIAEFTDETRRNAEITGASTTFLQQWGFAAGQNNVKAEAATIGITKLSEKIGEAREKADGSATAFSNWGIALNDAQGNALPIESVIDDIADKMASIDDPARRAAMAVQLFGKGGAKLVPMLKDGSAALREMMAAATVVSAEDLQAIDALDDAWTRFKTNVLADGANVVGVFTRLGDALGRAAGLGGNMGKGITRGLMQAVSNRLLFDLPNFIKLLERFLPTQSVPPPTPPGAMPADQNDLDAMERAREAQLTAGMDDAQRLEHLRGKYSKIQNDLGKLKEGTAAWANKMTEAYEIAAQIEAMERKIAESQLGATSEVARAKNPLSISTDAATRVGAFIGGMRPGLVTDILGRQQLTEQQKIARNTFDLLRVVRAQGGGGNNGGFE
jgi:hypothetical protein